MIDESDIRDQITKARAKKIASAERYESTGNKYFFFDKGYWLGYAHALETVLDEMEDD